MDICISGGVTTDDESWELELEKGERYYLASNWTYTLVIVSEPHRKTYNYTISTTPSRPTNDLLRCVRGLYMTLCPHSLHLILSVVFMAVFAPQSIISYLPLNTSLVDDSPPQMYSIVSGAFGGSLLGILFGFCWL
jgi:hypothetical protein